MAGEGIKNVLQATPTGYLTEMEDGSQVMFPEHVLVDAGLVGPTPGLYQQQPDPAQLPGAGAYPEPSQDAYAQYQAMQRPQAPVPEPAAPVQPAAPAAPGPAVSSMSASNSGQTLVRRNDVTGAPPAVDFSAEREAMHAARGEEQAAYGQAQDALKTRAKLAVEGGKVQAAGLNEAADQNREFAEMQGEVDAVVHETVARKTAELNERIARVPQEDPSRIWSTNNAFQNAAGLFAAIGGGILAVTTGSGRNMGLEAVERVIQRDIEAQRTNIESEWKKVAHDENTLQQYKDWQVQSKAWAHQQNALMLESLAFEREAKALTFSSPSKAAELNGLAAELRAKSAQAQQSYIKDVAELASREANGELDRWYKTESLSLEKLNSRADRALKYAQADKLKAETAPESQSTHTRIGELPMTGEDIHIPNDIYATMSKEDATKLRATSAKASTFVRKGQEFLGTIRNVGRVFNGPGKHTRPITSKKVEQARAAFRDLQFDEVVARTGLTATDAATQKILEILTGTGELPSVTVGSGDWAAFTDYVTRNIERDADTLQSHKAVLVGKDGKQRAAGELGKDARRYADAVGNALREDERIGKDPVELANSAMSKLATGGADDVIDGIYMLAGTQAKNSQGDLENPALAESTTHFAQRAGDDGRVYNLDGQGLRTLAPHTGSKDDVKAIIRASGARALARTSDPHEKRRIREAINDAEQMLSETPEAPPADVSKMNFNIR